MLIALLLMAWMVLPATVQARDEVPDKPTVTVTGHGQLSLSPDTAFLTVGIETTGKTVADAQRQNRLLVNRVVERLKALQIENERIQTASFTVSPRYKPAPKRSDAPVEPPEIIGYVISNTVTVEVRNLDKVPSVVEESLAAGANSFHGLHWGLRDEQQAKVGALKQAASKAREKAAALSEALKVKLIRLLNATEESHVVRPLPRVARSMMATDGESGEMPVFSGQMKVEATVTLIYEIGQE
jgi:uncharacterized protein YggE